MSSRSSPSDRHASTAALLPSDASPAITPRVPRFEASRTCSDDRLRQVGPSGSVLRPKPRNRPPDGFVAKPPNPAYGLQLLAATSHRLCLDGFMVAPSNPARRLWLLATTLRRLWFCGKPINPDERHRSASALPRTLPYLFLHHVARTWSRRPPGPSNQAYLSLHSSEATSA